MSKVTALIGLVVLLCSTNVHAQADQDELQMLRKQIEMLTQRLDELEQKSAQQPGDMPQTNEQTVAKVESTIQIDAPPEQVLETVLDTPATPEWAPSLEKVWDVQGYGAGCTYKWQYKMGGASFEGSAEITEASPERIILKTSGGIPSTWVYELTQADGGTQLNLSIDYTVPGSILGAIADKLLVERQNKKEINQSLANLKARLEG